MNINFRHPTWNVRRATSESEVWRHLSVLNPTIATLQEVNSIPDSIRENYSVVFEKATNKNGKPQKFGIVILSKYPIESDFALGSEIEWVDAGIKHFSGNLLTCRVTLNENLKINVISVYSPAWRVDPKIYDGFDVSEIKLVNNPDLWVTELLWAGLRTTMQIEKDEWIVAGDFNSSVTFDYMWGGQSRAEMRRLLTG